MPNECAQPFTPHYTVTHGGLQLICNMVTADQIRGVHDTGIPMGPMGITWEAQTEFMGMGTAMGMVDRN